MARAKTPTVVIWLGTVLSICLLLGLWTTLGEPPPGNINLDEMVASPTESKIPTVFWDDLLGLDFQSGEKSQRLQNLEGQVVQIPGFVLIENARQEAGKSFLLAPNGSAGVHQPPPPPNQMVRVSLKKAITFQQFSGPVWVIGEFQITDTKTKMGVSAFTLNNAELRPLRY